VARIYPAFCVVFAIYIVLSLANPALSKFPKEAAAAWLYVFQNFLLLPCDTRPCLLRECCRSCLL
jgi:peptidoglycan/LPS O-acetylase OafA/YrhL